MKKKRNVFTTSSSSSSSSSTSSTSSTSRSTRLGSLPETRKNCRHHHHHHHDDDDNNNDDKDALLFQAWLQHDSLEFHSLSDPQEATLIRQALLDWYDANRRKLPWRGDDPPWEGSTSNTAELDKKQEKNQHFRVQQSNVEPTIHPNTTTTTTTTTTRTFPVTPYGIWVSEVMLQQTRVQAVVPYWVRWMTSFPTIQALAEATPQQVNAHFAGLGFYRRARLLHTACQYLVQQQQQQQQQQANNDNDADNDTGDKDGPVVLPKTSDELVKLPGIGRYTACAIASIAHGQCVAVVDGNVCRVLARLRGVCNQIKAPAFKDKYGWDLAQQIVQAGDGSRPGDVNQALMELGATYCAPAGTGTDPRDPLKDFYWSTKLGLAYENAKRKNNNNNNNATKPFAAVANKRQCPVCIKNGIAVTLERIDKVMEERPDDPHQTWAERARQCGHASLPLAPPKPKRRDEVLAVAVLSSRHDESYLMVKRPSTGLLAGQWEFPAACVWTSGESRVAADATVPTVAPSARRQALNKLLSEILTEETNQVQCLPRTAWQSKRQQQDTSVEHVFSHVRHTMWIESKEISRTEYKNMAQTWKDCQGREIRWMNAAEMKSVGVTSGVKKILKVIQAKQSPLTKKRRTE